VEREEGRKLVVVGEKREEVVGLVLNHEFPPPSPQSYKGTPSHWLPRFLFLSLLGTGKKRALLDRRVLTRQNDPEEEELEEASGLVERDESPRPI